MQILPETLVQRNLLTDSPLSSIDIEELCRGAI